MAAKAYPQEHKSRLTDREQRENRRKWGQAFDLKTCPQEHTCCSKSLPPQTVAPTDDHVFKHEPVGDIPHSDHNTDPLGIFPLPSSCHTFYFLGVPIVVDMISLKVRTSQSFHSTKNCMCVVSS